MLAVVEHELDGESRWRDEAWLEELPARVAKRRSSRRRTRIAGLGAITATAGLALALLVLLPRSASLTYEVLNGSTNAGYVIGGSATKLQFSDGSKISLKSGTEAKVAEVDPRGARLNLRRGEAHVEITKAPHATWYVDAGPYTVHVTGTAFDVSWSEKERVFELALHHGSVVVKGPLVGSGFTLKPGQRMVGRTDGYVVVEGPGSAPSQRTHENKATELDQDTQEPSFAANEGPPSSTTASSTPSQRTSWASLVAQGKFRSVIEDAQKRGLEQTFATASLEDLSALSDAARYARNAEIARRALLSERQRFPRSRAASDAAFLLGRLAEDSGGGAVVWYDRYLADSPDGPYASQALGRKMMLWYRQRGAASAEPLAQEYLQRYPSGPYASAARKLASSPTPP
jgi:hypothetical protein